MAVPFTKDDIQKAIQKLYKSNKSPVGDNVKAELLKYG